MTERLYRRPQAHHTPQRPERAGILTQAYRIGHQGTKRDAQPEKIGRVHPEDGRHLPSDELRLRVAVDLTEEDPADAIMKLTGARA